MRIDVTSLRAASARSWRGGDYWAERDQADQDRACIVEAADADLGIYHILMPTLILL